MRLFLGLLFAMMLTACAGPQVRGTGDLGLVIERASGHVTLVDTSAKKAYARIAGFNYYLKKMQAGLIRRLLEAAPSG